MKYEVKTAMVPLWRRYGLSLEEATAYSGVGRDRLIALADDPRSGVALRNGRKRLFRRKKLDEYIDNAYTL